jgi:hypothetical protein
VQAAGRGATIVLFLSTWGMLAILCGCAAWWRGRSVALWTVLGFGTGLVALGMVLILPAGARRDMGWSSRSLLRVVERFADYVQPGRRAVG